MDRRGSGILLHLTSLPSPFGIGDLGPWAYRFVDFLAEAGQSYWQILPLNPTDPEYGNSPYHSNSAFALNTLLISPELLLRDGLLSKDDLPKDLPLPETHVEFRSVFQQKRGLSQKAFDRFNGYGEKDNFLSFVQKPGLLAG